MDEIEKAVAAIRAQGGTDKDVEAYLREQGFEPEPKKGLRASDLLRPAPQWGAFLESAADLPTGGAFGFVGDAARSVIPGQPSFTDLRDARRERRESLPIGLQVASAVPGIYANPGSVLGPAKATAGLLARTGLGLAEGAIQGGASALGLNLGTSGPILMPTLLGLGLGAGLGGLAAPIAAKLAGRGVPKSNQNAARMLSNAADVEGFRPIQTGPNMPPPIAADALGEVGQGILKAAARVPEARVAIRPTMEGRASQQFPSLLKTLDEVTGTTTDDAVRLAQRVRAAEQARGAANAAIGQRSTAEALDVLRSEGPIVDPDATLRAMHRARAKAGEEYQDVWAATRGKPVQDTDASLKFFKTDVGDAAWTAVQAERLNEAIINPKRALPMRDGKPAPDAEAWHRMKEMVNKRAKVGPYEGPLSGVDAHNAKFVRDEVLPTLREQNAAARKVDLQYANMSDDMRAFAAGSGKGKWKSFDEMVDDNGNPIQALQDQYRAGLRARYGQAIEKGASRDQLAKRLSDPTTRAAKDFELAFGEGAAQRAAERLARQAPSPPSSEVSGFTAGEGLFDAPVVGTSARPSVSEVRKSLLDLPVEGQAAGQKGLAGRYRNSLLEGRPLGLDSPAQRERFGMAATSPEKARRMVDTEAGWDQAMKMQERVLAGDVVPPTGRVPDVFGDIVGGVSVNPWWWLTQTVRRAGTEALGAKSAAEQAATALELAKIAKSSPDAIGRAISTLKKLDAKKAKWSGAASARAGRVGGLLGSSF